MYFTLWIEPLNVSVTDLWVAQELRNCVDRVVNFKVTRWETKGHRDTSGSIGEISGSFGGCPQPAAVRSCEFDPTQNHRLKTWWRCVHICSCVCVCACLSVCVCVCICVLKKTALSSVSFVHDSIWPHDEGLGSLGASGRSMKCSLAVSLYTAPAVGQSCVSDRRWRHLGCPPPFLSPFLPFNMHS